MKPMMKTVKGVLFMDWKKKLTSRKFWIAVVEFISMLLVALGKPENVVTQVSAIVMAGAGVIAYIIGEGLADAAGASKDEYYIGTEDVEDVD